MESIAVRNLSFRYPGAANETLRGVDFRLDAGDFAVLIGATGSGKSTLLRLLKPELAPLGTRGGEIRVAGEAVPEHGYGTGRRTCSLFRLRGRDVALIISCLLLAGVTIAAAATGALRCEFYPRFAMDEGGALGAAGYACYALLALAPAILEWEEKLRWRALRSGT